VQDWQVQSMWIWCLIKTFQKYTRTKYSASKLQRNEILSFQSTKERNNQLPVWTQHHKYFNLLSRDMLIAYNNTGFDLQFIILFRLYFRKVHYCKSENDDDVLSWRFWQSGQDDDVLISQVCCSKLWNSVKSYFLQ
jgi:hypothetical protein